MIATRTQRRSLILIAAAFAAGPAKAAEPPFGQSAVRVTARERDIAEFLREFFAAAGLNAVIDSGVRGKVNGRFEGSPAATWRKLAQAFSLVAYFDSAIVTVYPAASVQSRPVTVPAGRAADLVGRVRQAGWSDSVNRVVQSGTDMVMATGVPRYLDQVQQLAGAVPGVQPMMRTAEIAPGPAPRARPEDSGPPPIEPYELRVFYLRYARADDTTLNAAGREIRIPGVGATLSRIMGDGSPVAGGLVAGYGDKTIRQSQPRLGGRGLDATPPAANQAAPYEDEYLGLPTITPLPVVEAEAPRYAGGGPRIAIDPALNAVIVRDRPENMRAYEGLVQALDVRPMIVELEATIIDLNIDKLRELGINWRIRSEGFNSVFGSDIVRRDGIPANDIANTGAANRGLSLRGVIGSNQEFIGRVTALEEEGAARIVSRPQLVTLSNVEAVFDRTRTFYVRVAGDRQVDLFNVSTGTVLRVNPHVLSEDGKPRIRMVIRVEDGTVLDASVDDIPIVERASIDTQALINEGEGLLLGGLTVNSEFDAENGIPLLKDIPVLGHLFKSSLKQRRRTERLFLITPRLVSLETAATAIPAVELGVSRRGTMPAGGL